MLLLALAVAAAAPPPLQVLRSPAFDRFAAATDAACAARRLRFVTPADLDAIEADFVAREPKRERRRLAAADDGDARCAGRDGLACPATATLDAFAAAGVIDRFAAFACAHRPA